MIFITGSPSKFAEMQELLPGLEQFDLDLPEIQGAEGQVVAMAKLRHARQLLPDQELITEDTGLYLDCLNGLPGPLIKRFMKKLGTHTIYDMEVKMATPKRR